MKLKAILFGSIGTLIETSDLQRRSFNQAFSEAKLDWHWSSEDYQHLLLKSGGQDRIKDFATRLCIDVDTKKLYQQKTKIFDSLMAQETIMLRPGVAALIKYALDNSFSLGFVTSTSEKNIDAVFFALRNQIKRSNFSFIGNNKMVSKLKPNPDIYLKALSMMNLKAKDCIAIEDTEISMRAAIGALIPCIGFPGAFAQDNDFRDAILVTENLSIDDLTDFEFV